MERARRPSSEGIRAGSVDACGTCLYPNGFVTLILLIIFAFLAKCHQFLDLRGNPNIAFNRPHHSCRTAEASAASRHQWTASKGSLSAARMIGVAALPVVRHSNLTRRV